ncbi:MAG: hypothetical protein MPL62_12220 [Alphaproteobacteria bacterium]|nr:hypothetical protein [Alphaproteobacteria bacterium]
MSAQSQERFLDEILSVEEGNAFLQYIVSRLRGSDYRGWHVSQHNRYALAEIEIIVQAIHDVVGAGGDFAILPRDAKDYAGLPGEFADFAKILELSRKGMGKGTINSLKKNFFTDMDRMGFLDRSKKRRLRQFPRPVPHGKLTENALAFLGAKGDLMKKYKIFTDGIDRLFGNKISRLAETISLSDYATEAISIYEFMFILSDKSEDLDKIEILGAYRSLGKYQKKNVIKLIKRYADPDQFGDKASKRDFHNWKNQIQQMMGLLKATVYFDVVPNRAMRMNALRLDASDSGFFVQRPSRSATPKREYFSFHGVEKKERFELHHIVPFALARNKKEAKVIDDHMNLIYLQKAKHKQISENRNDNVVLDIDPNNAKFSDFDSNSTITATNKKDALYSDDAGKVKQVQRYNAGLLKSIFDYPKEPQK